MTIRERFYDDACKVFAIDGKNVPSTEI